MSLVRNLATVGSATLVSRVLGFIRDAGVAALLGAGPLADAYVAALQIPNLFRRLLADGAVNSAFVPAWLRIRNEAGPEAARQFGLQAMGVAVAALGVLTLACIVFAPTFVSFLAPGFDGGGERAGIAAWLLRLSMLYVVLAGATAIATAILNAEGDVASGAYGIIAFNIVLVAAIAVVIFAGHATSTLAAGILAASFVAAGCVQLIVAIRALKRQRLFPEHFTFADSPDVRRFLSRAMPGTLAAGIPQLVLIVGAMVASPSSSAVAWLYYTFRLYELPLGIVSIAIAAVLTRHIAASIVEKDAQVIASAKSYALEVALGLSLPAATGLAILSAPITRVLFERGAFGPGDTMAVAAALTAVAGGLAGHAIEKVLGAISFAHEDARTPMLTALAGLAVSGIAAVLLFPAYGHVGIAAAIALSGWTGGILLLVVLWRRGWITVARSAALRMVGIASSTLLMGVVITLLMAFQAGQFGAPQSFIGQAIWLSVLIAAGIAVYLASLWQLGIANIPQLLAQARGKP
jgi:putative peptidoglycan lipid II flippase